MQLIINDQKELNFIDFGGSSNRRQKSKLKIKKDHFSFIRCCTEMQNQLKKIN